MFGLENSANNFGASAGLLANTLANRPVQAALGTLFVGTNNLILYRYNGSTWDIISGGGIAGATNGLQVIGTNIGLGGTLTQSTNINCNFNQLLFQQYTNFEIGNATEIQLSLSNLSGLLTTLYLGQPKGIYFDYSIADYFFGDRGNFSGYQIYSNEVRTYLNGNGFGLNTTLSYVKVGDWSGAGTNLSTTYDFSSNRISNFSTDGYYNFANIPAFANNAAALAGGLIVGDIYRHTGGGGEALHIVF
jgi:hypothetical protein